MMSNYLPLTRFSFGAGEVGSNASIVIRGGFPTRRKHRRSC
jgi:hypothetical protein